MRSIASPEPAFPRPRRPLGERRLGCIVFIPRSSCPASRISPGFGLLYYYPARDRTQDRPRMTPKNAANQGIRNIAIIAHVDHGKTTLVDAMFRQSGVFREGQETPGAADGQHGPGEGARHHDRGQELLRDMEGASRSTSWTPPATPTSAAKWSGPSRWWTAPSSSWTPPRGPLPQTRFVLNKALEGGLSVIVVINKIDRPDARPDEVLSEIINLFIDLGGDRGAARSSPSSTR